MYSKIRIVIICIEKLNRKNFYLVHKFSFFFQKSKTVYVVL